MVLVSEERALCISISSQEEALTHACISLMTGALLRTLVPKSICTTPKHISIVSFQSSSSPAFLLGKYTTRSRSFQVHALTDRCNTQPAVLAGEPSYSAVLDGNLLA